jgi:regulatory protein
MAFVTDPRQGKMLNGEDQGSGKQGSRARKRQARPLDEAALRELALAYVARFATSRSKLVTYLRRKLRERGWAGGGEPDPAAIADHIVALGFIDDAAFAGIRASSLLRRGYGKGRVRLALQASGIEESDGSAALELADEQGLEAALHFARRKRIGPFAPAPLDLPARQKALAAMLRAGHGLEIARRVLKAGPDDLAGFDAHE